MRPIAITLAAALAGALLASAPPAQAVDFWGPYPAPKVVSPIPHTAGRVLRIQLQAPRHAWGIRRVARNYDERLGDVRIYRHGRCADRPTAVCVKVHVRDYGKTGWIGLADAFGSRRAVLLNRHYVPSGYPKAHTACHELGHVLGLAHHRGDPGCLFGLTPTRTIRPSRDEIQALRLTY